MHTTYCDGKNSAEEMILAAIDKGLDTVGISGHSFTWFDTSYCMSKEGTESYLQELDDLKEKYAGRIRVLKGIELDYYADTTRDIDITKFDYIIGSSHYIFASRGKNDFPQCSSGSGNSEHGAPAYIDVDYSPDILLDGVNKHFDGDIIAAAEAYYRQVGNMIRKTDCDVIGHFDLITKFIEQGGKPILDTKDLRYIAAWHEAIDRLFEDAKERSLDGYTSRLEQLGLIEAGDKPVFEINAGAMAKGYRTSPYPAQDQLEYIRSRGGILILNSDSHSTDKVAYVFDKLQDLI